LRNQVGFPPIFVVYGSLSSCGDILPSGNPNKTDDDFCDSGFVCLDVDSLGRKVVDE